MVTFRERRRYPRVSGSYEWLVLAQLSTPQYDSVIITDVKDISRNGIRCDVDLPFSVGQQVAIKMLVPVYTEKDSVFRQINFHAKIMRTENLNDNSWLLGLMYTQMSKYDNRRIGKYVEYVKNRIKPKRKRRTKAQMLAARMAEEVKQHTRT